MENQKTKNSETLVAVHTHTHTHTHTGSFRKRKNEKGITLIALVITIIALIILAGISLLTLSGQNGILARTAQARIEECHGVVKERMSLIYTQYMTDYKISNENKIEFQEYLTQNGIINENGKVDISKLCGTKQFLGNGTDKDIYTFKNSKKQYIFEYVEDDGTTKEILKIAKDTSEGIDYSELEPGLYKTGTNQMIMSWDELFEKEYIGSLCCNQLVLKDITQEGDLVVAKDVSILNWDYANTPNITRIVILGDNELGIPKSNNLKEIICIGNAYMSTYGMSTSGISYLMDKCPNLKSINMTQQCYDKGNWSIFEEGLKYFNSNIKINIKNYNTRVKMFAEKLPKDPAEKEKVLTDIFIKGVNYEAILNKKDANIRFTTLQDVWEYIKNKSDENPDYTEFDTLTQYIDAVYMGNYEDFYSDLITYRLYDNRVIYSYLTALYIIDILDNLPTDETERWNKLTEVYIKTYELKYEKEFTTLQEVWEDMKLEEREDYTKYTTLKEYFEAEKAEYSSSMEYSLLKYENVKSYYKTYWFCQAEQMAEEEWFN